MADVRINKRNSPRKSKHPLVIRTDGYQGLGCGVIRSRYKGSRAMDVFIGARLMSSLTYVTENTGLWRGSLMALGREPLVE